MRLITDSRHNDLEVARRRRGSLERPKLVCFHHAGAGSSAFASWQKIIGEAAEVVPVTLPGRDQRKAEPRITDADQLIEELHTQLGDTLNTHPYILYGHSMGGLVAYNFARARERAGLPSPALVVIGATQAPHLASPLQTGLELPDRELLQLLVAHQTLPPQAAQGGRLWEQHVLPVVRDDLHLAQALLTAERTPLQAPLLALAARRDTISPLHGIIEWADYAPAGFTVRTVEGDHLFVHGNKTPQILREAAMRLHTGHIPTEYDPLAMWREAS
ncbi:surfactin synthase thioesterase subunit [Streptomyces sp. V4I23]|uniref:thioesterase II family protein n=1 Tax=Streptomyces sp. V4I23 TaxID=3042282 RepID=UPI00277EC646|nr:alpha/beta fold hydrolase [Streptomyces sp. V4I23]MDQ1005537.1 surfactin synthase thioesterase subunit [Streptomyces sp. V4I23]MDQ1005744.1 surfactin synthase thioesterase subunit [Streptomyces sp. V4I23]